jgi:hypothetical protein
MADTNQVTDVPPGDGWSIWIDPYGMRPFDQSPTYVMMLGGCVEIWRHGWGNETHFATEQSLHPATNVAGLYWRPA